MAITRTAMIDDDGTGTTGTILNNAWKQELYNQIDATQGTWIRPAFSAAIFGTVGGGAWTVDASDVQDYAYYIQGGVLFWNGYLNATSITGTPSALKVTLPSGRLAMTKGIIPILWAPNGVNELGFLSFEMSSPFISLQKLSGNLAATTNTTYLYWTIALPII